MPDLKQLLEIAAVRSLTTDERTELQLLVSESGNVSSEVIEWLTSSITNLQDPVKKDEQYITSLVESIVIAKSEPQYPRRALLVPGRAFNYLKLSWLRWASAAAIVIGFGVAAYFWLKKDNHSNEIVQNKSMPSKSNVLPGQNKAILILGDSSRIDLNNISEGMLAQESGAIIRKSADGRIVYLSDGSSVLPKLSYNTMVTPRGGQYQLLLPDGSRAWLNAESSITFPTVFVDSVREVRIKGEVYFEIKKDKSRPFIVKTAEEEILVMGTSFNVNAYENEGSSKISLLEGSVKIKDKILKPGQAYSAGKLFATNIEKDIAWKNGYFNFNNADLPTVIKQLERWYDIRVEYRGNIPVYNFRGELDRGLNLSEVLEILGDQGVNYLLKERTLIISPKGA